MNKVFLAEKNGQRRYFSTWENAEKWIASLGGRGYSIASIDVDDFCPHTKIVQNFCCYDCEEAGFDKECADCGNR
jgi:hypothetical protein